MKRLAVVGVAVVSSVASVGSSPVSAAANPSSAVVDCNAGTGNLVFTGQVGDAFDITNSSGGAACEINGLSGKASPSGQGYSPGMGDGYVMSNGLAATFTISGAGTFSLSSGGGALYNVSISLGSGGPTGPVSVVKGSFDPNGGECLFDGQKKTSAHDVFVIGYMYAPGASECSRPGYVFADWMIKGSSPSASAGLPVLVHEPDMVRRHFVAQSGNYVAKWSPVVTFDLAGGTCTILSESRSGTFSVAVDEQGQTAPGSFLRVPAREDCSREGHVLELWVVDDKPALFGDILVASSRVTAVWRADVQSISIIGSRGSANVSLPSDETCRSYAEGPPPRELPNGCVVVYGVTTGFAEGTTVTPEYRFPGQTSYTTGIPVTIDAEGEFTWYRKTGKKIYVRFVAGDNGDVVSSRVIIPAK